MPEITFDMQTNSEVFYRLMEVKHTVPTIPVNLLGRNVKLPFIYFDKKTELQIEGHWINILSSDILKDQERRCFGIFCYGSIHNMSQLAILDDEQPFLIVAIGE